MEDKEIFIIYIGVNREGNHQYTGFYNADENDGRPYEQVTEGKNQVWGGDKKRMFKKFNSIGQVFKVTLKEGSKISYNAGSTPVSHWKNLADRSKWALSSTGNEGRLKQIKEGSVNPYREILKPMREAYQNAHHSARPHILAEIIQAITG